MAGIEQKFEEQKEAEELKASMSIFIMKLYFHIE